MEMVQQNRNGIEMRRGGQGEPDVEVEVEAEEVQQNRNGAVADAVAAVRRQLSRAIHAMAFNSIAINLTTATNSTTTSTRGSTLMRLEEMGSGEAEVVIPDEDEDDGGDIVKYVEDDLEADDDAPNASTQVGVVSSIGSLPHPMHSHPRAKSPSSPSSPSPPSSPSATSPSSSSSTIAISDHPSSAPHMRARTLTPLALEAEYTRPIKFNWRTFSAFVGPGWLMSIAYLDPGNLEGDLQAGALAGYQLLWVLLVASCMGIYLQVLAARLGVTTGKNLAQLCRQEYPVYVRNIVWLMMELVIIGSDIQEILGSAIAFRVLFGIPLWAGSLITAIDTFSFLCIHYFGVRKLEAFFVFLVGIMLVCFFVNFGYAAPPASGVASGFIPVFRSYALMQAIGLVGSNIMPHNVYLQSALVQSRKIDRERPYKIRQANYYFSLETSLAVAVSFIINLAVVSTFANGFFREDCAVDGLAFIDGRCSVDIGLSRAGDVLSGFLGSASSVVWAIGLLASGQSSTMTGTYTGQFVMSGFLDLHLKPYQRIAVTRCVAIVPAILVSLSAAANDHEVDVTGQWINVFMSVQLPFATLPLLHFTSSERLMGRHANTRWMNVVGYSISLSVITINLYLLMTFVFDPNGIFPQTLAAHAIFFIAFAIHVCFVLLVVREDVMTCVRWLRAMLVGGPFASLASVGASGPFPLPPVSSSSSALVPPASLEDAAPSTIELAPIDGKDATTCASPSAAAAAGLREVCAAAALREVCADDRSDAVADELDRCYHELVRDVGRARSA